MVVECAPAAVFRELAEPVLRAGKKLVVLSSGALLRHADLIELARQHGAQIIVRRHPGTGRDHRRRGRDPFGHDDHAARARPAGRPYLADNNIDLTGITEPRCSRLAARAAVGFPANLNVAVSVSLAGIGPTGPRWKSWADPALERNIHRVEVDSDSASFSMEIQNIPRPIPRPAASPRKASSPRCASDRLRVGTEHAGGGCSGTPYAARRRGVSSIGPDHLPVPSSASRWLWNASSVLDAPR